MPVTLRHYQQDAVQSLLAHNRWILGDTPGLGKTFPAILAAQEKYPTQPKLVVAPAYLLKQWAAAIRLCVGDDAPIVIRRAATDDFPFDQNVWVLCSYHAFLAVLPRTTGGRLKDDGTYTPLRTLMPTHGVLLSCPWGAVIFDEAHRLRGRKSIWTKNSIHLNTQSMWMLTGSPIVNNPGDLWPLLHLIDRKTFTSYWRFVNRWCVTETNPWTTVVLGIQPEKELEFHNMLESYMLRRTLAAVIAEEIRLTGEQPVWTKEPVTYHVPVDMTPTMKRTHERARRDWFIEHPDLDSPIDIESAGALLTKLRQLTAGYTHEDGVYTSLGAENPKIQATRDLVTDHNEPVVVFCWFKHTAFLVAEAIRAEGRPVWEVTGARPGKLREQDIEAWNAVPNGVIVATIEALQEGANLQHSSMVIFVEHGYLPTVIFDQCIGRVRRMGQTELVRVYHLTCSESIDILVWKRLQERKHVITRALLDDLRAKNY